MRGWYWPDNYYDQLNQQSDPIFLKRGERYPLRITTTNYIYNDQAMIAIKLKPKYLSDGITLFDYNPTGNVNRITSNGPLPLENVPKQLPETLKMIHGMKDMQTILFTYNYAYEKQVCPCAYAYKHLN